MALARQRAWPARRPTLTATVPPPAFVRYLQRHALHSGPILILTGRRVRAPNLKICRVHCWLLRPCWRRGWPRYAVPSVPSRMRTPPPPPLSFPRRAAQGGHLIVREMVGQWVCRVWHQHVQRCQRWLVQPVPAQQCPAVDVVVDLHLQCRLHQQRSNGRTAVVQPYVPAHLRRSACNPTDRPHSSGSRIFRIASNSLCGWPNKPCWRRVHQYAKSALRPVLMRRVCN